MNVFSCKIFSLYKGNQMEGCLGGNHRALLLPWAFPQITKTENQEILEWKAPNHCNISYTKNSEYLITVIRYLTSASIVSILEGKCA